MELSQEEARYLIDVLDIWIDGHEEDEVIDDPMNTSPEELLSNLYGYQIQKTDAVELRSKLSSALAVRL